MAHPFRFAGIENSSNKKRANDNNHKANCCEYNNLLHSSFSSFFVLLIKCFVQFVRQNMLLK